MSNDYDIACRRMVKSEPGAFLAWLLTDFTLTARFLRWIDTRSIPFPGKADQIGDLVAELEMLQVIGPLWALALEFQSEPDPDLFGRMLQYLGQIWCERRPDPLPASRYQLASSVVNLTGTSQSVPASASFVWSGPDRVECVLHVRERYLAEESAEVTLEAIAQGRYDRALLPWIPLMRGGSEPQVIARCVELAEVETDQRKRSDFAYHTHIFAEKSGDPSAWHQALEGWAVIKSPTMEKTRNEGRAEGRVEGRAEGRVEGRQETLLEALALHTRQEVPADLATKIRACSDLDQLRTWLTLALTADTLEVFRQQAGL